jgi:hypothetical protein
VAREARQQHEFAMSDKADRKPEPLPAGYRQGIIAAITMLLGFALIFARYWTFEAPGRWTPASDLSIVLLLASILLAFVALWRSLQPRDDDVPVYQVTLRWFMASIVILALAIVLAGLIAAGVIP